MLVSIIVLCCPMAALSKEPATHSHNLATSWMQLITKKAQQEALPPPPSLRLYAYAGITMYECMAACLPGKASIYQKISGQPLLAAREGNFHLPAVLNAATARLCQQLGIFKSTSLFDSLEAALTPQAGGSLTPEKLQASILLGKNIADAIVAWSQTDGNEKPLPPLSVSTQAGAWLMPENVTLPQTGIALTQWRLFLPGLPGAADPGPPPAYSEKEGSRFRSYAEEVFQLRNNLSPQDSATAIFWKNNPPRQTNTMGHMQKLLVSLVEKESPGLEDAITLYAKHGMLMHDVIACSFFYKHQYRCQNPVTYIQQVMNQPAWNTLYFYNYYPGYPSNQVSLVEASAAFMERAFGKSYAFTDSANGAGAMARQYTSFRNMSRERAISLLQSGIDYRFSTDAGKSMGRKCEALLQKWME